MSTADIVYMAVTATTIIAVVACRFLTMCQRSPY